MQDFQERVVNEKNLLGDNLGKLIAFMHTDAYSSLSSVEQGLLMVQQVAMENYVQALKRRIELF